MGSNQCCAYQMKNVKAWIIILVTWYLYIGHSLRKGFFRVWVSKRINWATKDKNTNNLFLAACFTKQRISKLKIYIRNENIENVQCIQVHNRTQNENALAHLPHMNPSWKVQEIALHASHLIHMTPPQPPNKCMVDRKKSLCQDELRDSS